ncbi:hypothetical protein [Nonomuraea sp. SBT364]|uniref:hypothetical protein n=1 Tax=Nonomuraea sp. SBT364 TaxID=1580530 RepID=UPI00066AD88D|nr:hypothetical protein [Nonomuraea sp. SBT364]
MDDPGRSLQVLSAIGFGCAAVAVLFRPVLFGPAGIVLGLAGHSRGEQLGKWTALASAVTMIVGMIVSYLLAPP